jgi:hypothetical protein
VGLFSKRLDTVELPRPPAFGLQELPDIKVWRKYREAIDLTLAYVAAKGPEMELPLEVDWFVREFADAIWASDEACDLGLDGLAVVEATLRVTAMAGAAFAAVEEGGDSACPPGRSLASVRCALVFGVVLLTDDFPEPLLAAGIYTMRVSHFLCRSPEETAKEFVPSPLPDRGYFSGGETKAFADAIRLIHNEGS